MIITDENKVFFELDGKEYCDEELALSILLKEGVLFANSRDYTDDFSKGQKVGHTIVLYVLCNDLFAWGCADAEDLPFNRIEELYRFWDADHIFGPIKWCCKQRNEKPQASVVKWMKECKVWEDWLDCLSDNHYDNALKEHNKEKQI